LPHLCLCLSQVGVLSKRLDESSWFWHGASFHLSYTVLKGNSGISKIRVLPFGTLSQTPDLESFALEYRLSKRDIDLAGQGGLSHVINKLVRHRSTKLTILPSSDSRPLYCAHGQLTLGVPGMTDSSHVSKVRYMCCGKRGLMSYGVGLGSGFYFQPFYFSVINLRQVVYTHAPLSPCSTVCCGQMAVISYGWEGNRRSGVALHWLCVTDFVGLPTY